jgi:hypothetical protein
MTEELSPLEHLQRAALELIAAARSTLDRIEELVSEPPGFNAVRGRPPPSSSAPEKVEHIPIR